MSTLQGRGVVFLCTLLGSIVVTPAFGQKPAVGPNINMVSGTKWPSGDPFLTKQNEPSIAVSSLNAQHLLAGANDYRMVDLSQAIDIPGETGAGDAWIFLFTSVDGGSSWKSRALSGCPQNVPQCNNPLSSAIKGRQFAADPTVRPGPYGTFFLSFIAANRGSSTDGVVAVQRFLDRNNNVRVGEDPIVEDVVNILDSGTSGQFKDKPWVIADVGGRPWNAGRTCTLPGFSQPVPAFNVYVSYSNFVGNSGSNPHPQVLVARSRDCGQTFENPVKVSNSVDTNSGSVLAIDPATGDLFVVWRRFGDAAAGDPDRIYVSRSTDGGSKFNNPSPIASFAAFDQGTSAASFRTNALPSAVVSVDAAGKSRVHVVWAQRKSNGDARIAMSTSSNGGQSWTQPHYLDDWSSDPINPANPGRGHQFQPTLTFAGGKLMAAWFDQRYDHTVGVLECQLPGGCSSMAQFVERREPVGALASGQVSSVFTQYLTDAGQARRHTIDTFAALAAPADRPVFQSGRASQFLYGNVAAPPKGSKQVRQIRFNVPNFPIFVNNTRSFLGDYLDASAQIIVPTGNAAQPYQFNTSAADKPVFHLTWTDNRDVLPPLRASSSWQHTPSAVFIANADGSVSVGPNPNCLPGFDGSKNQNIYTAKVGEGVAGFVQVNSKDLSSTKARGFVVGVQNLLTTRQTYQLRIPAGQPGILGASFDQDSEGVTQVTLNIPPRSSASRMAWVRATSAKTSLRVEIADAAGSLLKTLWLNPDPAATGAFLANPDGDISNNDLSEPSIKNVELTNVELTNVELTNVELTNVELTNVELTNVELTNVELTNVELTNVELTNVELTNVELTNVELTNVELTNNNFQNVELTNGGLADATFTVTNRGTADTTLNMKTLLRDQRIPDGYKLQLVMRKVAAAPSAQMTQSYVNRPQGQCKIGFNAQNIQNANIRDPRIENPDDGTLGQFLTGNSDENNATLPLLAGERAQITMRVLGPSQAQAFNYGQSALKFVGVGARGTITHIPLVIKTLSLPAGTALSGYEYQLLSFGGAGSVNWAPASVPNALPSWLSLTADGWLRGTPPASGVYALTVRITDSGSQPQQSDVQQLSLTVQPAAQTIVLGTALPAELPVGGSLVLSASAPGGPVAFSGNANCVVSGASLNAVQAGTCTLTASQAGSSVYAPAILSNNITIVRGNQTIAFAVLPDKIFGDASFQVSASASSLLPVSFTAAPSTVCAVSGNLVQITGAGSCTVTARQPGDSNYNPAPDVARAFNVAKATLTVTAQDKTRAYGGTDPEFTAALSGFVNGQTLAGSGVSGSAACSTTATAASPAGPHPITCTQGSLTAANYTFTFADGTLTIGKAALTVTANNQARAYGAANPALTYAITGFLNNDPVSVVTGMAACTTTAGLLSLVGPYTITCAAGSLAAANYSFAFQAGVLTVEKATLTVTASSQSRLFGTANLPFTASYAGFVNGETLATSGVAGPATFATEAGVLSPVAVYTVTPGGLSAANYTFNYVAGSVTVLPATPIFSDLSAPAASLGGSATISGKLTWAGLPATGAVSISLNGGTPVVAPLVSGSFSASVPATGLGIGSYPVSITYPGSAPNFLAASAALTLRIQGFEFTGTMTQARRDHTATLLNSGLALIAGGLDASGAPTSSAELYDPATGSFRSVSKFPNKAAGHTATLLLNGKVLIAGGGNSASELFNPATETFDSTGGMSSTRSYHSATLLPGGKVLLAGGSDNGGKVLNSTLIFDPATGIYSAGPNLLGARERHTATSLLDGRVLIAGGRAKSGNNYTSLSSAEIYDPATNKFTAAPAMPQARHGHTAVILVNGKVLLAGGVNGTTDLTTTALFDPAGTFAAGSAMSQARSAHAAVAFTDGTALVSGGKSAASVAVASSETYGGSTFSAGPALKTARSSFTMTVLANGSVLVTGGAGANGTALATAEILVRAP